MECVSIYKCLCDETRLRILNLLCHGPLCVCHVQAALGEPQAKISKQLNFMKRNGMLVSRRKFNWTIYEIPSKRNPILEENLKCLQDSVFTSKTFKNDRAKLAKIDTSVACEPQQANCC